MGWVPAHQANDLLRRARETRVSPSGSGRPMSRQELADAASVHLAQPVSGHYIAKLERGELRWPAKATRDALRRVLGASHDHDLGFYINRRTSIRAEYPESVGIAARLSGSSDLRIQQTRDGARWTAALHEPEIDTAPAPDDTNDVQRRTFIIALATLGISYGLAGLDASGIRSADSTAVENWSETAWEYSFTYVTAPRAQVFGDIIADLALVMSIMESATTETVRAGLADAAAKMAGIAAMCCVDLGYRREARHTWRLARRLADESGSVDTRLWVRGREAVLGLYSGRPVPVVLDLVERGLAIDPDARNAGRAGLGAAQAQAFAILGRRAEATAALHRTEDVLDALPTGSNDTIFDWTEQKLRHTESFVYGFAGVDREADRAQDRALAMYAPDRAVSRAQIHLHQSVGAVRSGDVNGGVLGAAAVLESLPTQERGDFVLAVADMVLSAVPVHDRHRPAVTEYRELVGSIKRTPGGADGR